MMGKRRRYLVVCLFSISCARGAPPAYVDEGFSAPAHCETELDCAPGGSGDRAASAMVAVAGAVTLAGAVLVMRWVTGDN